MVDADSVLGDIKIAEIYALGNAWIQLGDDLYERRAAVNGHVEGIGMTGAAGNEARRAWNEGLAKTVDAAAENAWTIGQTINRYAAELYAAAEEYAKQLNAAMWANILGILGGLVLIGLGPLLGRLLALIGSLLARLIPVLATIAGRLGSVGSTIVGVGGGAVAGAASEVAFDMGVGALGAEIAGTDFKADWTVAISAISGAAFGAHGGGMAGRHFGGGNPSVPKPNPGTTAPPSTAPPGVTPVGSKPVPGGDGGGAVPPPSRLPGGDHSLPAPGGSGNTGGASTPPALGGRGGDAATQAHPTNSGSGGGGRSADVGMPSPPARSDGSSTAPPPTPVPGRVKSQDTGAPAPAPAPTPGPAARGGSGGGAPQPPAATRPGASGEGVTSPPPVTKRAAGSSDGSRVTPDSQLGGGAPGGKGRDNPVPPPGRSRGKTADWGSHGPGRHLPGDVRNSHGTPPKQHATDTEPNGGNPHGGSGSTSPIDRPGQRLGDGKRVGPTPPPKQPTPDTNTDTHSANGTTSPLDRPGQRLDDGKKVAPTPPPKQPTPDTNTDTHSANGTTSPLDRPGQRLDDGRRVGPTPPPKQHAPDTDTDGSNFKGAGRTLGDGQKDPYGFTTPRPDGTVRATDGETGPVVPKPSSRKGAGYDRPFTMNDLPSGTPSGAGRGPGSGAGSLRPNYGNDSATYTTTHTPSDPPGTPQKGGHPGGSGVRPPSPGKTQTAENAGGPKADPHARQDVPHRSQGTGPGTGSTGDSSTSSRPTGDTGTRSTQPVPVRGEDKPGTGMGRPNGSGDSGTEMTRPGSGRSTQEHEEQRIPGERHGVTATPRTSEPEPDWAPDAGTNSRSGREREHGEAPGIRPAQETSEAPGIRPTRETSEAPGTRPTRETSEPPISRQGTDTAVTTGVHPHTEVPPPSHRHPGAARFDVDAARARLDDPTVPPDRREESLQWSERAVWDRIQQVAPGRHPSGVVARPDEVVELVAAEHLRAGHLPAGALLGSLVPDSAHLSPGRSRPESEPVTSAVPDATAPTTPAKEGDTAESADTPRLPTTADPETGQPPASRVWQEEIGELTDEGELGGQALVHEVRRELQRLKHADAPVTASDIARLHAELPDSLRDRGTLRQRGEAIAQTVVTGRPFTLPGGMPSWSRSYPEAMEMDDEASAWPPPRRERRASRGADELADLVEQQWRSQQRLRAYDREQQRRADELERQRAYDREQRRRADERERQRAYDREQQQRQERAYGREPQRPYEEMDVDMSPGSTRDRRSSMYGSSSRPESSSGAGRLGARVIRPSRPPISFRTPVPAIGRESSRSSQGEGRSRHRSAHRSSRSRSASVQATPQEQLQSIARNVLAEVPRRISLGAGNQASSRAATGGANAEILAFARGVSRQPVDTLQQWLGQNAAQAQLAGAGNCGENAAMAFVLLNQQRLPAGASIWYVDLNLKPDEDPRRPIAPYVDHVFTAIGFPDRPLDIVIVDPWQLRTRPILASDPAFTFPFLVGTRENPQISPRAVQIQPDGVDYLAFGLSTINRAELDDHMQYAYAPVDPSVYVGQPGMYEHVMGPADPDDRRYYGLRGGSPDTGIEPVEQQWHIGRDVTLAQPRRGGVLRGPAAVMEAGAGGTGGAFTRFDLPLPVGGAGSSATPLGYEVNPGGWIRLPDGTELSPLGWTSFGDDFIHVQAGALLRGDNGWIGRIGNIDQITAVRTHLDPQAFPHTPVPTDTGLHMVPAHPDHPAVHIPLTTRTTHDTPPADTSATTTTEPHSTEQAPLTERTGTSSPAEQPPPSQETQLFERDLVPLYVPAEGDALAHALTAVAPGESSRLAGHSWPAGPEELRAALGDALAGDLRLPPRERRLWPAVTEQAGPSGTPLASASGGSEDAAVRVLRTGTGPDGADWLTLAVAAPVLGLRLTVLTPDGTPWTTGPDDGRPVVLLQQEDPLPHTARWAATEPAAQARKARRPDVSRTAETSGSGWGTTSGDNAPRPGRSTRPDVSATSSTTSVALGTGTGKSPARTAAAVSDSSGPTVFFGPEPRPAAPAPPSTSNSPDASTTPPPARETIAPASTAPEPRAEQGTDTHTDTEEPASVVVPADDRTEVAPAGPREDEETPRTLSPYALTYGARHDGSLGLVTYEPLSEALLGALHQQVLDGLGVAAGSTEETAVREQLAAVLSQSEIGRELPQVRSARGHRVTVTVDGREHAVDVRLRLTDPALPTRAGASGEVPRRTALERHGEGGQSSSRSAGSGTMRTVPVPWIGIYNGPAGPLRWFDGSLVLSLTHHQSSESLTVHDGLTIRSMQRANERAHAVDYTGRWQIRVDADRNAPVDAWGTEQGRERLAVWFPEHRVFGDGESPGTLPAAAGLDDLPLWGVDEVLDPGRLLEDLRADENFAALNDLGAGSQAELEEFLSERMLRGGLPMQRDGGAHSPVLFGRDGSSVGVLRLDAVVLPQDPADRTPEGEFSLESWLTESSGVNQSSQLSNGVGLSGSGGPMFTPDHAAGHPDAAEHIGGSVMGRAGATWQSSDALNISSAAALMHALYTTSSHLLAPADITYRITLIRSGGGEITGSYGPWPDSVSLRLTQQSTALGHAPTPQELRRLPEHLENLESIGFSAVPLAAEGTGPMFDRAETWLRQEGFLPPTAPEHVINEVRAERQLENLRRFARLRSRHGQAAALPDAVDGGRPLWFDLPDQVSGGTRRVQLRFSATRDRTPTAGQEQAGPPPAVHTRRLPDVEMLGSSSHEARAGRQRGNQFGGTLGGGGGPRFPLAEGAAALDATVDYTYGATHDSSASAGAAAGTDAFNVTTGAGTELFDIPALFTLDLYEGTAEEPVARFATEPAPHLAPGTDAEANPRPQPAPPTAAPGRVRLAVPNPRTLPATSRPPAVPAGHQVRAPVTGGGQDDDLVRLRLTDDTGRPQPGLLRLPDDVNVDVFRGSAALQEAFRQLVTGTYPGHPAVGTFGQWIEGAARHLPDTVTGPGNWLWGYLTGPAADDQRAFAGEVLYQQVRVASLLGRAAQIFNGGYVIEGLTLPGFLADQKLSLEIVGYLHHPTHHGSYRTYAENDLGAKDTSAKARSVTTSQQYGGALTALQSAPAPASDGTARTAPQANPSVRGTYSHRTARTSEQSAGSSVVRIATESGEQHLIGADATLLVTLRQGTRNVALNGAGLGGRDSITVAIDLPRAVRFQLSQGQLARFERWFAGVPGVPRPLASQATVPLPDRYVRTRALGFTGVLSVTQLDDPIRRHESRDRMRRELLALVEREAPGVTRPEHFSYRPGVATLIADMTAPAELRALPGRGGASLWFRHGGRLVEIALTAEPEGQSPALRQIRGRPAGEGAGLDQISTHAPHNRAETETVTRSLQASANPISRYARPYGRTGHTDRTGPVLSGTGSRSHSSRTAYSAEDGYWTRTENAADFDDVGYTFTGTVRSKLVQDWPPDLVGGALESGFLSLTERDGGELVERLRRLLRGRPARQVRVPAAVALRFAGSEAVAPRQHAPAVRPRVTRTDPRLPAPQGPLPLGEPPFVAGPQLIPTGATPVFEFNAFRELAEALETVAPDLAASWGLPADLPPDAAAVRLGELVQSGEILVDMPRTAAGLTSTMPGAWPAESEPATPRLQVTLHNPRPISDAADIAVDRLRVTSRSIGSASSAASTAGLGYQFTQSGNEPNLHLISFTLPVLNRQPLSRTGNAATADGGWDRFKTGSSAASASETVTRSHETLVDTVVTVTGPGGTRHVTGSAIARVFERDLLGYGVTGPRTASQVYDLPSMLAEQPHEALRNWATHPVTELPAVLARRLDEQESAAQLWLHLGADPDAAALARALYVGSRTAAAAGRPVELVLRGATGLRFWPFAADGSLADLTPATQDTWRRLRTAIVTATDATDAEADQVARERELLPRQAQAERQLADARRELDTATEAQTTAAAAHATARTARASLAERLGDAETALARAHTQASDRAAAVAAAEEHAAHTEHAVLDARQKVNQQKVHQEAAQSRPATEGTEEPVAEAVPDPRTALAEAEA
ncbi:hypothetical protein [Streptomyces sp. SYP-A7185]|uniref:hypothetical protein n=1 Tax=Streptomyces sp. SYP-A7185 TaxID=3040076 RepID=UPI0038F6933E